MRDAGQPIERRTYEAQRLFHDHPPVLHDGNKKAVFDIACPPGATHGGRVVCTRWAAMPLPGSFAPTEALERMARHDGFYDYQPVLTAGGAAEWHVNFADPSLFFAYGGALFAQDEMQVAEHPVLGAVREALRAEGAALTVEAARPTPVLVAGAERRCRIATEPNAAEGRPRGLYGNEFARATKDAVRRATTRIHPPTVTNVLAMAAPAGGRGAYARREIELVLVTAFTGFRAAVLEGGAGPVAVHTGFWGCGAFGGNRVLMSLLQVLAAGAAGVDRLVLHAPGKTGAAALDEVGKVLRGTLAVPAIGTEELLDRIAALGLEWGVSNGT